MTRILARLFRRSTDRVARLDDRMRADIGLPPSGRAQPAGSMWSALPPYY